MNPTEIFRNCEIKSEKTRNYPTNVPNDQMGLIFSGSPLFTGGAGSGESDIRKWIIESDWLEAIIALPEQMFYNTGIGTYVWIVSNRKEQRRKGKSNSSTCVSSMFPCAAVLATNAGKSAKGKMVATRLPKS